VPTAHPVKAIKCSVIELNTTAMQGI